MKEGPLAQLVEHLTFNQVVARSNRARPTIHKNARFKRAFLWMEGCAERTHPFDNFVWNKIRRPQADPKGEYQEDTSNRAMLNACFKRAFLCGLCRPNALRLIISSGTKLDGQRPSPKGRSAGSANNRVLNIIPSFIYQKERRNSCIDLKLCSWWCPIRACKKHFSRAETIQSIGRGRLIWVLI